MADIAECFFWVKLPVRQRDFFCVLWVEDGRIDGNIEAWRFTVQQDLDLTTDDMPIQKAMGLQWLPQNDVLHIKGQPRGNTAYMQGHAAAHTC